jgi:hypothetical protein
MSADTRRFPHTHTQKNSKFWEGPQCGFDISTVSAVKKRNLFIHPVACVRATLRSCGTIFVRREESLRKNKRDRPMSVSLDSTNKNTPERRKIYPACIMHDYLQPPKEEDRQTARLLLWQLQRLQSADRLSCMYTCMYTGSPMDARAHGSFGCCPRFRCRACVQQQER